MADELNIITPTPAPDRSHIVRLRTPHQLALVELAAILHWPEVVHTRANGFQVRIGRDGKSSERAWVQFAIDGRRKDQFAILAELAAQAYAQEQEILVDTSPPPYLQLARVDEPTPVVRHRYTRADGTLG